MRGGRGGVYRIRNACIRIRERVGRVEGDKGVTCLLRRGWEGVGGGGFGWHTLLLL